MNYEGIKIIKIKFSKIKYIYKFIIFLLSNFIILYYLIKKNYKIKIALCTMGKNENLYAKEFILYYKKLGVDKMFIYDDNDLNTEKINDVNPLKHFAKVYENIKDKIKNHSDALTECYQKHKNKFNWFLMVDMDEFLVIVNNTLKNYLSESLYNKCDFIKIHWAIPSDNNLLHYDNRSLFERFKGPYLVSKYVKTIVKGDINDLKYHCHSASYSPLRNVTCNNKGNIIKYKKMDMKQLYPVNIEKAYIIHFKYKSTEEFINKFKRGYSNWHKNKKKHLYNKLYKYLQFKYNKITKEKLKYIENELNVNLKKYYKKIKLYY